MKEMLEHLINENLKRGGEGVIQAQIRFKRDGFTAAGAVKRSAVAGIYELLTVAEDHTKRGGGRAGVVLYFEAGEVGYVGMQFEASPIIRPVL